MPRPSSTIEARDSRVLVVGGGSIGQRHARLLGEMGAEVHFVTARPEAFQQPSYPTLERAYATAEFDYCVIASPTASHAAHVRTLSDMGFRGRVMVEKPLVASSNESLPLEGFTDVGVGYNIRFHPAVTWLRENLAGESVLIADVSAHTFLPTWRPGRDYRSTSSALSRHGGGVLRDLSHELDLLLWLFGQLRDVDARGRHGDLGIETETVCAASLSFDLASAVTLRLSYVDRLPERRIRLTTASNVYEADLLTGACQTASDSMTLDFTWDETYRELHRELLCGGQRVCSSEEGLHVVEAIEALEVSMARHW